ncbi:DUF2524 family protein [Salirhabdus salicampi]|uniref:DUF2524 family protein n=1 Tax=Salirhabdus salicampi TaxID=476102 RepID=UPI0020C4A709|nr:DUF2524 family protein [Salirhabdus salicampi]MCP8617818.1 YtzC family protein [Salirhabdus salicampi]
MTTHASMEHFVEEIKERVAIAKGQLNETNRNGYPVDEEYSDAQIALEQAERAIEHMMISANDQQKEELYRLHLQVSHVLNDMYLDETDLEQY